jgi:hypothetical protein
MSRLSGALQYPVAASMAARHLSHRDLHGQQTLMEHRPTAEAPQGSSDRSFGFVFAIVFAIIAAWPILMHRAAGGSVRVWALAAAAAFLMAAVVHPRVLAPLNRLWTRFGLLLHSIVSPVALGVIFFIGIMPIGLIMRAMGKRPLNLQFDRDARSYWVPRDPPGPPPGSMSDPF